MKAMDMNGYSTKLIKAKKASRMAYDKLITEKSTAPTVSQQKWIEDFNLDQNKITWRTAYQLAHKITKSTKLREFQFKDSCTEKYQQILS